MKFLDKLLGEDPPRTTTPAPPPRDEPEEITVGHLLDGELNFGNKEGKLEDQHGRIVAKVEPVIDPNTFNAKLRLIVPPGQWEDVEVVCAGNATSVETEPLGDGRYRVKRKLRGFRPAMMDSEETIELREFETTKQFIEWIEGLDTDSVEALRQIYYDRWNFDTASQKDRMYYELLEEEKKGRQK